MADLINDGGHFVGRITQACERGYSLTPVDISQSDHNPAEEKRTEHVNWNGSFVPLSGFVPLSSYPFFLHRNAKGSLTEECLSQQYRGHLSGK